MREVGALLAENSPKANASIYERFRAVLNEGTISHRVQYMIEVQMQVRKDKYKENPILPDGLDLVDEDDQVTHEVQLQQELKVEEGLSTLSSLCRHQKLLTPLPDIFKFDPNYLEKEEQYKSIKAEILGEDSEEDDESGSDESSEADEHEGSCHISSVILLLFTRYQLLLRRRVLRTARKPI